MSCSLAKDEIEKLQNLFNSAAESIVYLSIGAKSLCNSLLSKPITTSQTCNTLEIPAENKLLFLRILSCFLITPLSTFTKEDISTFTEEDISTFTKENIRQIREIFEKLARAIPPTTTLAQDTVTLLRQALDKILPLDKLSDQDKHELKKLYLEIYRNVNKKIPSLITLCEDTLIRTPHFYINYPNKEAFNTDLSIFVSNSKRIRENRETILNKASYLSLK
jgi:hypothetical protein